MGLSCLGLLPLCWPGSSPAGLHSCEIACDGMCPDFHWLPTVCPKKDSRCLPRLRSSTSYSQWKRKRGVWKNTLLPYEHGFPQARQKKSTQHSMPFWQEQISSEIWNVCDFLGGQHIYSILFNSLVHPTVRLCAPNTWALATYRHTRVLKVALFRRHSVAGTQTHKNNNSKYLCSTYYGPDIVLSALYAFIYLIIIIAPKSRCYYHPWSIDDET